MLDQLVKKQAENIIGKIMRKGIEKYAKVLGSVPGKIQIRITNNPNGLVNFEICLEYKVISAVTFLDILDRKIDLLGHEALSAPAMKKSLMDHAAELNVDLAEISAFLCIHEKTIGISFYNGYQNTKNIVLSRFLEQLD